MKDSETSRGERQGQGGGFRRIHLHWREAEARALFVDLVGDLLQRTALRDRKQWPLRDRAALAPIDGRSTRDAGVVAAPLRLPS